MARQIRLPAGSIVAVMAATGGCYLAHGRGDASSAPDASSSTETARDAGAMIADRPTLPTRSGQIEVAAPRTGPANFNAYFAPIAPDRARDLLIAPDCELIAQAGACRLVRCDGRTETDRAGRVTAQLPSETLSADAPPYPLFYAGGVVDGYYAVATSAFASGDVIHVVATGATVPAFSAAVVAPAPIDVHLPVTLSRSVDLTIRWTPASADIADAEIMPVDFTQPRPWVICSAPDSAGVITVPASMVAAFATGETVLFNVGRYNHRYIVAGDYEIEVIVERDDGEGESVTIVR